MHRLFINIPPNPLVRERSLLGISTVWEARKNWFVHYFLPSSPMPTSSLILMAFLFPFWLTPHKLYEITFAYVCRLCYFGWIIEGYVKWK